MLTVNTDIQDHLINGPLGKVTHIIDAKNIILKVYVKFFYTKSGFEDNSCKLFQQASFLGGNRKK